MQPAEINIRLPPAEGCN